MGRDGLHRPRLLVGLYDQSHAANSLNAQQDDIRLEWLAIGEFVGSRRATGFPPARWSFSCRCMTYLTRNGSRPDASARSRQTVHPVRSGCTGASPRWPTRSSRWQQRVGRLPGPMLATALDEQGFAAILVDRNGYADHGKTLAVGARRRGFCAPPFSPRARATSRSIWLPSDAAPIPAGRVPGLDTSAIRIDARPPGLQRRQRQTTSNGSRTTSSALRADAGHRQGVREFRSGGMGCRRTRSHCGG